MSLQVFLQAQLLGADGFLSRRSIDHKVGDASKEDFSKDEGQSESDLFGRCAWLNLYCEVLPRALLAELRLSNMLLGSSSAEQFLLVLAEEDVLRADEILARAAEAVAALSERTLRLVWATTENLGAWPVARKRLDDALAVKISARLANQADPTQFFAPFEEKAETSDGRYFASFGERVTTAAKVGWSSEQPAFLQWDEGQYSWPLKEQSGGPGSDDGILFPRRTAMTDEEGGHAATPAELASRAEGTPRWGILKGDVDQFAGLLKNAASIEDHIHLSVLFKEFFAGELSLLCTLPDFWRKVSILYRGGDDFAVMGTWDGLLMLARELERLFQRFAEQNLQAGPGVEAKTVSMALAIAPEIDSAIEEVFQSATEELARAKAVEAGTFFLFGRTLEWKRLADAEELKTSLVRLVKDFGYEPEYIHDLAAVYREACGVRGGRRKAVRVDKPWRTYMRLTRVIPQTRGREIGNVRNAVITSLVGKRTAGLKLRPSARVGLEWARMAAGDPE